MTRARDHLDLVQPLRMFIEKQHKYGDRHVYAPRTRFLTDAVVADRFDRVTRGRGTAGLTAEPAGAIVDVASRLRAMW